MRLALMLVVGMFLIGPEWASAAKQEDIQSTGRLFQERCMACHGAKGKGDGALAAFLDPKPRNFTSYDEMRRLLGDTEGIIDVIKNGSKGTAMPAFASHELEGDPLTDSQVEVLADYVQRFLSDEQYIMHGCATLSHSFDTSSYGDFEVEFDDPRIQIIKGKSTLKVRSTDPKAMVSNMTKNKIRTTRAYFRLIDEDNTLALVTVRLNLSCVTNPSKKSKTYLIRTF